MANPLRRGESCRAGGAHNYEGENRILDKINSKRLQGEESTAAKLLILHFTFIG
jgi:hypothetical protein